MDSRADPDRYDLGSLLSETRRLCPEVRAAVLVGPDGLVVERFCLPDADLPDTDLLAAEGSAALEHLRTFATSASLGSCEEWILRTERAALTVRRVPSTDLWLMLLAAPHAWHGRLRFAARVTAGRLRPLTRSPGGDGEG